MDDFSWYFHSLSVGLLFLLDIKILSWAFIHLILFLSMSDYSAASPQLPPLPANGLELKNLKKQVLKYHDFNIEMLMIFSLLIDSRESIK